MHLDTGRIQRNSLDLDTQDLLFLQFGKHAIDDAGLCPPVHARVDRMPFTKTPGQAAPFAAMLCHIKDGVDHLQIADADVAALHGQTMFDSGELLGRDIHALQFIRYCD